MKSKFAVLILTHGRADNVKTIPKLRKYGYTGEIYLVIDHLDKQRDKYIENFGADKVFIFDKFDAAKKTDAGDNFKEMRAVVYARNIAWEIAEKIGLEYFLVLDDDYHLFQYRYNDKLQFKHKPVKNLDAVFEKVLEYYASTNFLSIALAQGGDYIGGAVGMFGKKVFLRRKVMNSFFCATNRPFKFFGKINEDTTAYVRHGEQGRLFGTINQVSVEQGATQQNAGGLTDIYLNLGTYVKSFYSVMWSPSCVKCAMLRSSNPRIHHMIRWKNAVPCILDEKYKKV